MIFGYARVSTDTLVGMAAGLVTALALGCLGELLPRLARVLLPVALVPQTMPLVALTPLLVLLLGRGSAVTIAITFFPAFVTIAQGLAMVPRAAFDLVRVYAAVWHQQLRFVALQAATPYLFAAARLAVPRALLGVMIAEWLATGRGLGNLLNQSRGYLDYGMIWTVALVFVLIAVALYQLILTVESWVLRRMERLQRAHEQWGVDGRACRADPLCNATRRLPSCASFRALLLPVCFHGCWKHKSRPGGRLSSL